MAWPAGVMHAQDGGRADSTGRADEAATSHTVDAPMLAFGAVSAATWAQLLGMPDAWPRTWRGYGSRLGDQVGFITSEELLRAGLHAAMPVRDITSPCEGAGRGRRWAARGAAAARCGLVRTFVAQDAAGTRRPHVPLVGTIVGATAISLAWRPERASAHKAQLFLLTRAGIVTGATVMKRAVQAWRDSRSH